MIAAVSADDSKLMLIEDNRNPLIRLVIDEFCPRFTPGATVLYARNVGTKFNSVGAATLEQKGIVINKHDRLPDVIIDYRAREWLVVVEATSPCRPISLDRRNELTAMLSSYGQWVVFISAFMTRQEMANHLTELAWETEVWVAESPDHLIHFNGERFLGPYEAD